MLAGAFGAAVWLVLVALNLALAGYFDIAVRDVVMSIAAVTLARLTEARQESLVHGGSTVAQHRRHVTA